jgi:hypothetical protein
MWISKTRKNGAIDYYYCCYRKKKKKKNLLARLGSTVHNWASLSGDIAFLDSIPSDNKEEEVSAELLRRWLGLAVSAALMAVGELSLDPELSESM